MSSPVGMPAFPVDFLKGVALSVYQNSGDENGQWTKFSYSKTWLGYPRINGEHNIRTNSNFWDNYAGDIALAKTLNANALRFSLEWSRLMPLANGVIDQEAVNRYNSILDELEKQGLEPMATLHHFVHPQWFEDMGGFTKQANCAAFADYAAKAFQLFGSRIKLWCTFNEPTVVAFCGWMVGIHPPGLLYKPAMAGQVMCNLLHAHTLAYDAIKALPGADRAAVGIVHHHVQFESFRKGWAYCGARTVCWWMTHWFGWDTVVEYFKTGKYEWQVPFGSTIRYECPRGKPPCDWWGINYYTRFVMDWNLKFVGFPGDVMTDMSTPVYPEGMYKAIMSANELGIPIYITETGMSDGHDTRRPGLIVGYWQALERAINDGADVRGQFYWTLLDNFEWHEGYTLQYGLFAWSPTGTPNRVARRSALVLASIYANIPKGLPEVISGPREAYLGNSENGVFPPDETTSPRPLSTQSDQMRNRLLKFGSYAKGALEAAGFIVKEDSLSSAITGSITRSVTPISYDAVKWAQPSATTPARKINQITPSATPPEDDDIPHTPVTPITPQSVHPEWLPVVEVNARSDLEAGQDIMPLPNPTHGPRKSNSLSLSPRPVIDVGYAN